MIRAVPQATGCANVLSRASILGIYAFGSPRLFRRKVELLSLLPQGNTCVSEDGELKSPPPRLRCAMQGTDGVARARLVCSAGSGDPSSSSPTGGSVFNAAVPPCRFRNTKSTADVASVCWEGDLSIDLQSRDMWEPSTAGLRFNWFSVLVQEFRESVSPIKRSRVTATASE